MSIKGAQLDELIVDALRTDNRPLGANDLLGCLRSSGVNAPQTVYRALSRLASKGRIHRIESLSAYIACSKQPNQERPHEATGFAICTECGNVEEFDDHVLAERFQADARSRSFVPRHMTVEISGICAHCFPLAIGRPNARTTSRLTKARNGALVHI
jgi:Fur family zinc uptake transcriptional regulator